MLIPCGLFPEDLRRAAVRARTASAAGLAEPGDNFLAQTLSDDLCNSA